MALCKSLLGQLQSNSCSRGVTTFVVSTQIRRARALSSSRCTPHLISFAPSSLGQALEPAELLVAVAEGAFDASSHAHIADTVIRVSVALLSAAADNAFSSRPQGVLHLLLPAAYPASAAASVEALTSATLGREAEACCALALQALAHEAAAAPCGGQECLYPLVEAAMQQLHAALEAEHPAALPGTGAGAAAFDAGGGVGSSAGSIQLALLHLDHMHARTAYSRTLRRWAGELGLGGRLLFCSGGGGSMGAVGSGGAGGAPIILILLEGTAEDLREFVVRLRTRNVDVDSKGRSAGGWALCTCGGTGWGAGSRSGRALCPGSLSHPPACPCLLHGSPLDLPAGPAASA